MPHQSRAIRENGTRDWFAGFMDMRLGKSLTTIRWLNGKGAKRVLLLAPTTPLMDWQDELTAEGKRWIELSGKYRANTLSAQWHGTQPFWAMMTYASAFRTPQLQAYKWDAIVLDESTAIKNPKAGITKFVSRKLRAKHHVVLSGLPNPQKAEELFTQLAWCCGDFMGHQNFWTWRQRFCYQAGFTWVPKPGVLAQIKQEMHSVAIVMTSEEAGIKNAVCRKTLCGEFGKECLEAQRSILEKWAVNGEMWKHSLVGETKLMQLAGGHIGNVMYPCWKYEALGDLLDELPATEQVVVWCAYNQEAARVAKTLGGRCARLSSDLSPLGRKAIVMSFRQKKHRVLIANPALARYGLDLSCADVAVYFSCNYSYEARRQSEKRICHPKKTKPTMIIDMVTRGSSDEAVIDALKAHRSDAAYFMSRIQSLLRRSK
jgi:hypothetical protein